jgi:NAD-dependent dihydropyrimidine dehydrogenase PreA subunit
MILGGTEKPSTGSNYAFTTLAYQVVGESALSDAICREMPPQDVCGKTVFTTLGTGEAALRDIESMMYNPKIDNSNKEYDKSNGKLLGWWVIAPVVDSLPTKQGSGFEERAVTRYALVRISKICATGPTGCSQNGTSFDSPATLCGQNNGLYIDRISCVGCGTREMMQMPGLHPVLVK